MEGKVFQNTHGNLQLAIYMVTHQDFFLGRKFGCKVSNNFHFFLGKKFGCKVSINFQSRLHHLIEEIVERHRWQHLQMTTMFCVICTYRIN